jgi:hypothetical protein
MSLAIKDSFQFSTGDFPAGVSSPETLPESPRKTVTSIEKILGRMSGKEDRKHSRTINSALPAKQPESHYEVLGLERLATNQEIETAFLRKVRNLLKTASTNGTVLSKAVKRELVNLTISRDILLDSRCRDDHDLRLLSLKLGKQRTTRNQIEVQRPVKDNSADVLDALTMVDLMEITDAKHILEIYSADDQTQPFDEFLYRSQVIGREELESALLAREIVKNGLITREAIKTLFKTKHFFGVDFIDSILVTTDMKAEGLTELARQLNLKMIAAKAASRIQKPEKC